MSQESQQRRPASPLYTQVDITTAGVGGAPRPASHLDDEASELLRDILTAQDRTNELLEDLVTAMGSSQKQRAAELKQWKEANPHLARACRDAAEGLSQVQVQFLRKMTEEIDDTLDGMMDGEFMLSEFVDRFGPRLAHLNGVIQVLAQLSSIPNPANTAGA